MKRIICLLLCFLIKKANRRQASILFTSLGREGYDPDNLAAVARGSINLGKKE